MENVGAWPDAFRTVGGEAGLECSQQVIRHGPRQGCNFRITWRKLDHGVAQEAASANVGLSDTVEKFHDPFRCRTRHFIRQKCYSF